jgi:hypothetical protein
VIPLRQRELNKLIVCVIAGFKSGFVVGNVDLRGHRLYFGATNNIGWVNMEKQ